MLARLLKFLTLDGWRQNKASGRVLLEQLPDRWRVRMQTRRFGLWHTKRKMEAAGFDDCLLVLSKAFLDSQRDVKGHNVGRKMRKRVARKVVSRLLS